jgi:hypothetical protein
VAQSKERKGFRVVVVAKFLLLQWFLLLWLLLSFLGHVLGAFVSMGWRMFDCHMSLVLLL